MKKLLVLLMAAVMIFALVACDGTAGTEPTTAPTTAPTAEPTAEPNKALTYEEYAAIEVEEGGEQKPVVIECYVQGKQSWWQDKACIYGQDENGGYYIYNATCTEAVYNQLAIGTKIRVTGYKTVWAGEYEIAEGATFEIVDGSFTAEAKDLTSLLGKEELINYQNQKAAFKGLTISEIKYKNGEPGDDIYVTVSYNGAEYSFCVEVYLTGTESDVYKTVGELQVGDVVDIEGFLYWYNGANPHITAIAKVVVG